MEFTFVIFLAHLLSAQEYKNVWLFRREGLYETHWLLVGPCGVVSYSPRYLRYCRRPLRSIFEPSYYEMRPTIAVPQPGKENGGVDLDGRFALHPSLQPLKPFWDSRQLALIHAAGSPDPTRSHFDAQDFMESGTPGRTGEDGWLNRALSSDTPASPLRAIAIGAQLPR